MPFVLYQIVSLVIDFIKLRSQSDADKDFEILVLRSLQMCAHETYMDCSYYEQLMYVGDTRLEVLITYPISADDRLPRKTIMLFDTSRLMYGLIRARYPSRDIQVIPPFSLWWVGMVYDYALWRGDHLFIEKMIRGIRSVLDAFLQHVNADNLLHSPDGWNFADWTSEWPLGVPPDGFDGISGVLNWHLIYTLGLVIKLEESVGESELAQRWTKWRDKISTAVIEHFWNEQRGLFADGRAHSNFSEHTQYFSLLSGLLSREKHDRVAQ